MDAVIDALAAGVPAELTGLRLPGPDVDERADVLAYFDRPGTSNGPAEAINGRLEHLRGLPSACATSPTTAHRHS